MFTATQNAYDDTELTITDTDGQLTLSSASYMECERTLETNSWTFTASVDDINWMTEKVFDVGLIYADGSRFYNMYVLEELYEPDESDKTVALEP